MEKVMMNCPKPLFFIPPVSWFIGVYDSEEWQLGLESTFSKQTLRNRSYIGSFQGAQLVSIPLINQSTKGTYAEVKIDYSVNWQNQLCNALQTSYGKSPFFEYYDYLLFPLIKEKPAFLWDYNLNLLTMILRCLKAQKSLSFIDSEFVDEQFSLETPSYYQVFNDKQAFIPHLSILDLLFNEGINASTYLKK